MQDLLRRLNDIGLVGPRRALAALSLSLFIALYLLVSLSAPPGWGPAFLALAACYVVAFLAVVAEWFWGRWFAAGLGWSGVMVTIAAIGQIGWVPQVMIYGGLHGLVVLALAGKKMAGQYDLQEGWRQRFGMDEFGVARLRKTVTRASASLPSVILFVLGPKEGESMLASAAGIATLLLIGAGLRGLILQRSWGWLAVAGAAASMWGLGSLPSASAGYLLPFSFGSMINMSALPLVPNLIHAAIVPAIALTLATLPFLQPAIRFLRR